MQEFRQYRLDARRQQLWRGDQLVALRPKTWEVLRLLVDRRGDLIRTSEFLDAVWSRVSVTQGTLTQSIAELRRILGDDAGQPRFIQTVHHRGYRFIADLRSWPLPEARQLPEVHSLPPSPNMGTQKTMDGGWLPGREAELERLDLLLQGAHQAIRAWLGGRMSGEERLDNRRAIDETAQEAGSES